MSDNLVTIKVFSYDHETLLYEPQLQSAGIYYYLKDHKTATVDPFLSNAMGGIKLMVKEEDVERAVKLIREIEQNEKERDDEHLIKIDGMKFIKVLDDCPKCESDEVYIEKTSYLKDMFSFSKKIHYCKKCEHQWKR